MEAAMTAMFPKGIRALMVDDDNRFVRSATTLLSVLNFEVVTCSTVAHALKSLSTFQLKNIDVVLVHAAKAAACGFNFRAIIETDLGIPVIHFLPLDHRATGDEAEELLSTLEAGTYIMPTPLDVDEVRNRLWRVIAWRKCALDPRPAAGGFQEGENDEGRVHYKVVKCRKRKCGSSNAGEGSSAAGAGAGDAGGRAPPPPAGKGKEKVVEAGDYQQQPAQQKKCRGRKSKKSSGETFKPPPFQLNFKQPSKSTYAPPPVRQPPHPSLFVNSVLKTIKVPPHNTKFFSDGASPSNTAAAAFVGASSNAAAPPPPPRPPLFSAAAPPALPPAARHQQQQEQPPARNLVFGNVAPPMAVAAATVPAAAEPLQLSRGIGDGNQQQQQPAAHNAVFGNMAPPVAATAMDVATATSAAAGRSQQQLQDARPLLMFRAFGPFPYQRLQPRMAQQDMVVPAPAPAPAPAGGVFTGNIAGDGSAAGASGATGAGAYCNDESCSFIQPHNFAGAMDMDMSMHTGWAERPEHVVLNASHEAAMMDSLFNFINNHGPSGSPLVATDDQQVLGTASSIVSGPAMAGGEFGSWDAAPASFMAPQDLGAELNAGGSASSNPESFMAPHQDLFGAAPNGGNRDVALFVESHQDLSAATDGDAGLMVHMLASDQYGDDDTSFPLDALLDGLPSPLLFADLDGGAPIGGAADDSLIGREEGSDMNDLEALNGLEIPHDVFQLDEFLFPPQENNKNNGHE